MTQIKVSTHHAFLNTDIMFSASDQRRMKITDQLTGVDYIVDNQLTLKLSAGKHVFVSENGIQEVIYVEDAIKLGGSSIKEAFVFDNNPWCFVVTKDRLYATNPEEGTELVEYNLTPNEITAFDDYQGETCDYVLLRTKEDYTIYHVPSGHQKISFTGHIYSNAHIVIYKKNDTIFIYDYRKEVILDSFDGQYVKAKWFFYIKDHELWAMDYNTGEIKEVNISKPVDSDSMLTSRYIIMPHAIYSNAVEYWLYFLDDISGRLSYTRLRLPHLIESIEGIINPLFTQKKERYDKIMSEQGDSMTQLIDFDICFSGLRIEYVSVSSEHGQKSILITGTVVSYPYKNRYSIPFIIEGEYGGVLDRNNFKIKESKIEKIMTVKEENEVVDSFILNPDERMLAKSSSGNLALTKKGGKIFLRSSSTSEVRNLLSNTFDVSVYYSAYFTTDGKNVVVVDKKKEMSILGLDNMIQAPFEVEGSTVARFAGINGYNPEIMVSYANGRIPVWRDPITMQRISEADMSNHIFKAPNGLYTASMQMETELVHCVTGKVISKDEYVALSSKYNWSFDTTDEVKKNKIALRKAYVDSFGEKKLFTKIYKEVDRLYRNLHPYCSAKKIEQSVEKNFKDQIEDIVNVNGNFIDTFIDKIGYVSYKNTINGQKQRILIGNYVWFLNYVAFSYDSHYLAFGAKMRNTLWRHSEEGVFEIYDLLSGKVVLRKGENSGLYAVWMTMFSKKCDVAFYDSHANAYVSTYESQYADIKEIDGKSLLCFSPSGKYIAFSDQNYIDFRHHPHSEWGHQPSGNVFIYDVSDLETELEHHNDLGDGISGASAITRRAGNVASAAFSTDDKRLLAVGDDGVVVIRNLHLDEGKLQETDI